MKHDYFKDKEMHLIQSCIRLDIEGCDAPVFEDIEQKEDEGQATVESDMSHYDQQSATRLIPRLCGQYQVKPCGHLQTRSISVLTCFTTMNMLMPEADYVLLR